MRDSLSTYHCLVLFIIANLFTLSTIAQNKISFTASTDAKEVVTGGYFQLTFTLKNTNGNQFKPPAFKNFDIIAGPSRSMSTTNINGQYSSSLTFSYSLRPKKEGKLRIGIATIKARKRTYKTKPISIKVVKSKTDNPSDTSKASGQDVFMRAIINSDTAYIGQQVIIDFKLYTTVDIDRYNIISEPEFKAVYAKEIQQFNSRPIKEVINGVQYTTKILRRTAIFPQKGGNLIIPPISMRIGISKGGSRKRSPFSVFFERNVIPKDIASQQDTVLVQSVPPSRLFTGAVGKYSMNYTLNKSMMTTDDVLNLRMAITGTGDVKRLKAPPINMGSAFEVYEGKQIEEKSYERGGIILGSKTFEYDILPIKAGKFVVEPNFVYFDTDSLRLMMIKPDKKRLVVRLGKNPITTKSKTIGADDIIDNDIKAIIPYTQLYSPSASFYNSTLFWILSLLPFIGLGIVIGIKRKRNKDGQIDFSILKQQQANKLAQQRLSIAKNLMHSKSIKGFYEELSKALWGYVSDKLNIPTSELSKTNVKGKLQALNVSDANIDKFLSTIQTCEMALFASMGNEQDMTQTYENGVKVIVDIENELN